MVQEGRSMAMKGGPAAQRGRQAQPRKAELVSKKLLDHPSLSFSLLRHQRLQLPPFHFARDPLFAKLLQMKFSMWFLLVHPINLCFCCSLMTYRRVVEAEYWPNPWRKEWCRCGTPDRNSELQVEFFSLHVLLCLVSLETEWNVWRKTYLLCSSSMVVWNSVLKMSWLLRTMLLR